MNISCQKIEQLGTFDDRYSVWRQSEDERKRSDISRDNIYLVKDDGVWMLGRFHMQWYGWNFSPNMGSYTMQIEHLEEIYLTDLSQKKAGDTASYILGSLVDNKE